MRYVLVACLGLAVGCSSPEAVPPPTTRAAQAAQPTAAATVFEGARLITGDGSAPIERSAFVVSGGLITRVGKQGELEAPAGATRVDLSGKTVMPALVDAHSHLGYTDVRRMTTSAANFTRENMVDHLRRYAYYGIAATLSMGTDRGELPYVDRRIDSQARPSNSQTLGN